MLRRKTLGYIYFFMEKPSTKRTWCWNQCPHSHVFSCLCGFILFKALCGYGWQIWNDLLFKVLSWVPSHTLNSKLTNFGKGRTGKKHGIWIIPPGLSSVLGLFLDLLVSQESLLIYSATIYASVKTKIILKIYAGNYFLTMNDRRFPTTPTGVRIGKYTLFIPAPEIKVICRLICNNSYQLLSHNWWMGHPVPKIACFL